MKPRADNFVNLLHIYAVDIGEKTFPMEIYWSCKNFDSAASLVNPIGIGELIGRHEKYMQIHGVTYEDLKNFGQTPQTLCEQLNESFENNDVFVADDELKQTKFLLKELFSVGKVQRKKFALKSLNEFLLENLQNQENLEIIKEKAKRKSPVIGGLSKFSYLKDLIRPVKDKKSFEKYEQTSNFNFSHTIDFYLQLFKKRNCRRHRIQSGVHAGE